jgi:beta-lactam-binding protein with PASTA domain
VKGKTLKAAKKRLRAANCRLGTVTKEKGVTAATGKVVKQRPKPGKVLTAGAKVRVKLG